MIMDLSYPDSFDPYQHLARPHSSLGIVSFVTVLGAAALGFFLLLFAGVMEGATPGGIGDNPPIAMSFILGLFAGLGINLLGIGLAIGALCQPRRNKLFAWLALGIGVLVVLGAVSVTFVAIVGTAMTGTD